MYTKCLFPLYSDWHIYHQYLGARKIIATDPSFGQANSRKGCVKMNPVDISLYAILDPDRCRNRPLEELAEATVASGATLLQFRDKKSETRTLVERARSIKQAMTGCRVPLIINDRVDVALAAGTDGVHLGQQDMSVEDARRLLGPDAVIGLSIKTVEEAETAPVELLDYAFIGGVYETKSKDNPASIGVSGWIERAAILRKRTPDLPIGAIAGIDEKNMEPLFEAGCDGVALISNLFMADDVADATKNISNRIKSFQQGGG